jgi:hypothetical protein
MRGVSRFICRSLSCGSIATSANGLAVVLPAWDGSETALTGSKSGFGVRNIGD